MPPDLYPAAALARVPARAPGPEPWFGMRASLAPRFVTALDGLAPVERAALLLRDVLGYELAVVAGMLGMSAPSAALIVLRARRRFTGQLQLGSGS